MGKISEFIESSKRIFVVAKKPSWPEYKVIAKITALGIIFIAVIGFVISLVFRLLCSIGNICL